MKEILRKNKEKIIVNSTIGLIVVLPTAIVTLITSNEKDLSLFKTFFNFKIPLWVGLAFVFFIVWFFNFMYKKEEKRKLDEIY
ncbi:MAG: hypothetical protein KAT32_02025, partial [Candidatus Moranbacteria bacterium]|nr:hypothetical protein [Candidatus Moranbacteria bacterium]